MTKTKYYFVLIVIFVVLLSGQGYAVTLHGSIYDIELNELNNVVVTIDSEPIQRYVSKDGAYSFELNPGKYSINATYKEDNLHEYRTGEEIIISEEGEFVYDLFLFPEFDSDAEELLNETELVEVSDSVVEENGINWNLVVIFVVIGIIIFLTASYYLRRKQLLRKDINKRDGKKKVESSEKRDAKRVADDNNELAEDLLNVVNIIKKEGGRITQKELRQQIPLSEAKISLMLSDLEEKKIIKRIKKGRGNVLVLRS